YEHFPVRPRATAASDATVSYVPYRPGPDHAAPLFSPIGGPHIVRFTGSSHDEQGFLTKDPAAVGRLNEHLWRKVEDHRGEIELVRADLADGAQTLFIAYGITARAMAEAVRQARAAGRPVSALTVQSLWPVPEQAILRSLVGPVAGKAVKRVVVAELNLGDFRREVERVIYRWAAQTRTPAPEIMGINRVDGELITPEQFMAVLL
ncbi:MAG: hypothetical protein N2439_11525, partial [Anaerolineae bacterium]|nr:hypothetical protein [Anaerolineae bacterium]